MKYEVQAGERPFMPLTGVREHRPQLDDQAMCCRICHQRLISLRFGIWRIWVSLESGQICIKPPDRCDVA